MAKPVFFLDKWYLDFIGERGQAKIFYAAKLSWYGVSVQYGSCLDYDPNTGAETRSHFRKVKMPQLTDDKLKWSDDYLNLKGTWTAEAKPLESRIFSSEHGFLDWSCHLPAASVRLEIDGQILKGRGYAEQLILTVPPWQIPMTDLRWGRFRSLKNTLVWIELRNTDKKQWVWLNGTRAGLCEIENEHLSSKAPEFRIRLDRSTVLESEKKIFNVVEKLLKFIPGFKKVIPLHFLLSDGFKWLSKGIIDRPGNEAERGMAIHEWVNFKAMD